MTEEPGSGTRWLDGDELSAWMPFCGLLLTLPGALDGRLQRGADLTLFGYLVLARLSEAPGRTLRMSDLAQMANGSLSRLSHAVARLERDGWVVRATCPSDGRFTNATLTDAGFEKLAEAAPGHVAAVRQLVLDAIGPDELAELGRIAAKVLDGPSDPRRSSPGCPPPDPGTGCPG